MSFFFFWKCLLKKEMSNDNKKNNGMSFLGGLGSSILGAGVGLIAQKQQNKFEWDSRKAQNKWNEQAARQNYEWETEAWNRTNEFNSPQAVMARYKAAGLNPNLIYGGGMGNTAGSAPAQKSPEKNMMGRRPMNVGGALGAYQDTEMRRVGIDNAKKQGELLEKEKLIKGAEAAAAGAYFSGRGMTSRMKGWSDKQIYEWMTEEIPGETRSNRFRMMDTQLDAKNVSIQSLWKRILEMDANIELKKKMLEYYDWDKLFKFAAPAVGVVKGVASKIGGGAKKATSVYKKVKNGVVDTSTGEYFR